MSYILKLMGRSLKGHRKSYNQMYDLESSLEEGRLEVVRMVRRLLP